MDAATLGVCAPNIVERRVQRLRVSIAKGARGAFRVPGSVTYRSWLLYCSSRVRGNLHARFLGGWARATAPGYPARRHSVRSKRDTISRAFYLTFIVSAAIEAVSLACFWFGWYT